MFLHAVLLIYDAGELRSQLSLDHFLRWRTMLVDAPPRHRLTLEIFFFLKSWWTAFGVGGLRSELLGLTLKLTDR